MAHYYPYESELKKQLRNLREGRDYSIWQSGRALRDRAAIDAPIIEIGGPTETGFFFLDKVRLQSEPLITNISANPLPYAMNASQLAERVKKLMDARDMPYEDGSVGAFLMAHMSISSDWWVELDKDAKLKAAPQFRKELDEARMEMGQVALGVMKPEAAAHAQRIQIYREIYRTLRGGGLFFSDGDIEEIDILKGLGFELIAFVQLQDSDGRYAKYEFVVTK